MKVNKLKVSVTLFIIMAVTFSMFIALTINHKNNSLIEYKENLNFNESIDFELIDVDLKYSKIEIKGWAEIKDKKFKCNKSKIIFENLNSNIKYIVPTYNINFFENAPRDKLEKAEKMSLFTAAIKKSKLEHENPYKIYIHFDNCVEKGLVDPDKINKF